MFFEVGRHGGPWLTFLVWVGMTGNVEQTQGLARFLSSCEVFGSNTSASFQTMLCIEECGRVEGGFL